ncbi:uncharacterized protein LOC123215019 [Mangifera indica]|uniref:uncharacterized protein LOC123215019 n=1 Tax=Mangifera indica TaxID=29780 RepID=UPI001CF9C049|nr:uncharacterized protein LOC123215019 [Mangifera indica]XP_044490999.1 uncharacterized protein LOC123215019 [Mangifera indica]XP_044491005.1 uncharacterized protein LOC123215019 [Mangifera indica]XP_044491014.1 uncharacterized protein LOC123215019 [Mangifera indica]XP_044491021.1 uncharacterized protein LOC123215019 [Mangifera indica]
MLSIENPPSDPSCSCQFPQLNTSHGDDSPSHKLNVDLLNPPPPPPPHQLPKFSIRDYVFTSRGKDIKKNWPFSLKNLQICLKHGVKDVLPPFQSIGVVKTQATKRWTVDTSSVEKKSISNFDAELGSGSNNNEVLDSADYVQLKHKLENACIDTSSCRSAEENDFPSTTTSVSQSEIESVPTARPSSSPPKNVTLLEASASVSASASASATVELEAGHPSSHKTENTTRPLGKKCRLIVKFSGNSDHCSTEDIASNTSAVSETMASKVCPVCKIFTSSSNTTLNAHIDQCLSAESTPKWTADFRVARHRIKPRKTRLMVDIYATAQRCTLEELDRRNGTSWASISNLPAQDSEKLDLPAEVKRQRVSQVHPEDAGEVGEVYIDANGTKLRILSKSNDAPAVSKVVEDLQTKNPLKGGKGSKFLSNKKKKRHARKHLKYLKLASQSRKFFSYKARASEKSGGEEGNNGVEESSKEKHEIQKKIKSSDSGTLRPWVCSKRRGLAKKANNQGVNQPFRCKWHLARDLLVENDQQHVCETLAERNHVQKFTNLSENLSSSPSTSERVENPFYNCQVSDRLELSSGRKRVGSLFFGARISDDTERSLPQINHNDNQLCKDNPFKNGSHTFEPSNSSRNCVSSVKNKRDDSHGDPDKISDILPGTSAAPPLNTRAFASKALRTVLRKKTSSVSCRSSVTKSKPIMDEKFSEWRKNQMDCIGQVDEEVSAWHSAVCQQYALMHNGIDDHLGREEITENTSSRRGTVPEIKQDRGSISFSQEDEAPQSYSHDEGENTDSSARAGDDLPDNVDVLKSVEAGVTSLSQSAVTKFHKLSNCSKTQSNSLHSVEDFNGILYGGEALTGPTEPSFVNGEEIYCSDEVGNGMIGQSAHVGPGLDSDIGHGNLFPEVDPIPIPGPPGSFLPSPRDMGSDDFQGNSSLTTSRVQSSQDQLEFVDGDSSDSPISTTSTISNSTAARSNLKHPELLSSVGAHAIQDGMRSGFSTASMEAMVENAAMVPLTGPGAQKTYFDGEKFRVNKISIEKRPLSFKNDGQPCCCQRKERISQDTALNYQESQLLRRRTMSSVTLPAMGKQNARPNNFDARPEIFPISSCPSFGSEKIMLPLKGPAGSISVKGSPERAMKFVGHGDCDSPSPSTPNPVLRLMGKNLMVINKEEDIAMPLGQSQQGAQNSQVISQFQTASQASPSNIQSQDCHSFSHLPPLAPLIFNCNLYDAVGPSVDVRFSSIYRNHTNPRTPQTPARVSVSLLPNQHINGGFAASLEPQSHMYDLSSRHNRPKVRLNETSSYNIDKVLTTLDHPQKTSDGGASIKEIIVIDDVPESESNEGADIAKYSEGLRMTQLISSGISVPTGPSFNSRHVSPFSGYQPRDPSLLSESPVMHNSGFHAMPPRLPNSSPVRWSCTPESSGVLQRNSFMAASTSTGHHSGSSRYYSPSL